MKRLFDIIAALIGLIILLPLLLIIALMIVADGKGGPFFKQTRVGRNGTPFSLFKFRTMRPRSESTGKLTIGSDDPRITRIGHFLRSYKLDELPQLWNILKGDMSFVGPRPEVPEYVDTYTTQQRKVLEVRPGLTDEASLVYLNEDEFLAQAADPEAEYRERILPEKLRLNLQYVEDQGFRKDLSIMLRTLGKLFG